MKINYFIYCFLIFIFLNSCGYQRIYQSTELNYNITEIEFKSDQKINKSIKIYLSFTFNRELSTPLTALTFNPPIKISPDSCGLGS